MRAVLTGRLGSVAVEITWTPEALQVRPTAMQGLVEEALTLLRAADTPLSAPGVGPLDRGNPEMTPHVALAEILALLDPQATVTEQADWPEFPLGDLDGVDPTQVVH